MGVGCGREYYLSRTSNEPCDRCAHKCLDLSLEIVSALNGMVYLHDRRLSIHESLVVCQNKDLGDGNRTNEVSVAMGWKEKTKEREENEES